MLSWGWPAPRIDAAQGLPFVALRIGKSDKALATALGRLSRDKSKLVRFNVARRLAALEKPAPALMWRFIDDFIRTESRFSVLDAVLRSMDLLWTEPEAVMDRVRRITKRTAKAPPEHDIHETLAATHLFQFLRTGRSECEAHVEALIRACDTALAVHGLLPQLHALRVGGWLTFSANSVRARAWQFLSRLLTTSLGRPKQLMALDRQRLSAGYDGRSSSERSSCAIWRAGQHCCTHQPDDPRVPSPSQRVALDTFAQPLRSAE
jgi:hypothetical protein